LLTLEDLNWIWDENSKGIVDWEQCCKTTSEVLKYLFSCRETQHYYLTKEQRHETYYLNDLNLIDDQNYIEILISNPMHFVTFIKDPITNTSYVLQSFSSEYHLQIFKLDISIKDIIRKVFIEGNEHLHIALFGNIKSFSSPINADTMGIIFYDAKDILNSTVS
jgi:hypothetical protein